MFRNPTNAALTAAALLMTLTARQALAAHPALQPAPPPEERGTIESQLKRYYGQTQFLNPSPFYGYPMPGQKAGQKAGGREEQESDVFKIGKPGSKLLYLLNHDRGLQVISYAKGANAPELIGRIAPTGNYPTVMYMDASHDRLLVLERNWTARTEDGGYKEESRLLVYDVSQADDPKVASTIVIPGDFADSRIVGSVLYVASREGTRGIVQSFRLDRIDVSSVQTLDLALPVSRSENMNIQAVEENGKMKYYLLAILSEGGWGWWDRKSLVEVVDISDEKGAIAPVMVASTRGVIRERSQTMIRNGILVAVSNYLTGSGGQNNEGVARIAVETFKLPTLVSQVITEKEAEFRKLRIDRELEKYYGEERDEQYKKLIADPELGIQGRFVSVGGKLRKIVPDTAVNVGDTQGLNANLRDVRFDGDLLYAFWVPQNEVDPFDLFDISDLEKGAKFVKRLYFDGWIDRAFPISRDGRKFVLGLGWTIGAVDNDRMKRSPQAMLFEITRKAGQAKSVDLAELSLDKGHVWTNFNAPDRYIELKQNADGTGVVMFNAETDEGGKYRGGGKLIRFDLSKADTGNVFQEGAFLAGEQGWVRRVFTNPEIQRVNTFSDQALGTYDVPDLVTAAGIVEAANTLELARNIRDYVALGDGSRQGVQIVDRENQTLELRLVDSSRADSELPQVQDVLTLSRWNVDHLNDAASATFWLASRDSSDKGGLIVSRIGVEGGKLKILAEAQSELIGGKPELSYGEFFRSKEGQLYVASGSSFFRVVDSAGKLSLKAVATTGCDIPTDVYGQIYSLGGGLQIFFEIQQEDPKVDGLKYSQHFIRTLTLETSAGAETAHCGPAINIPGRPVSLNGATLITKDTQLMDVRPVGGPVDKPSGKVRYRVDTVDSLESLALSDSGAAQAELHDNLELGEHYWGSMKSIAPGRLGLVKGSFFTSIGTEAGRFTKESFSLAGQDLPASAELTDVLADFDGPGSYLGLLTNGQQIQAVRWTAASPRPVLQKLSHLDTRFRGEKAAASVSLPGWYYSYSGRAGFAGGWEGGGGPLRGDSVATYNPALKRLDLPRGYFGIEQLLLVD